MDKNLDKSTVEVIERCTQGSLEGALRFPDVVAALAGAGVTHYHADFLRAEKTCYLRDGASHVGTLPMPEVGIRPEFSAAGVAAAVRASQQGEIAYPEFLARAREAGCIGYVVYIDGRRVIYTGRTGEEHVERFPSTGT